jgi:hypothetical protein
MGNVAVILHFLGLGSVYTNLKHSGNMEGESKDIPPPCYAPQCEFASRQGKTLAWPLGHAKQEKQGLVV